MCEIKKEVAEMMWLEDWSDEIRENNNKENAERREKKREEM